MKGATCCLCVLLLTEFIDSKRYTVKTKANGTVTNDMGTWVFKFRNFIFLTIGGNENHYMYDIITEDHSLEENNNQPLIASAKQSRVKTEENGEYIT